MTFASPEDQIEHELRQRKMQDFERMKHYAALTGLFLTPTLALMPPRKLDLYTVALGCGFVASASQLSKERYGRGLIDLAGVRYSAYIERQRQEKAQTLGLGQAKENKEKHFSSSSLWGTASPQSSPDTDTTEQELSTARAQEAALRQPSSDTNLLKKLWMGGEEEGWREKRAKEHEDALERGETIGDLIRAQVSEVWGLGEKKVEELKGKDEEVVRNEREMGKK